MCLAVLRMPGKSIPVDYLQRAARQNQDGFGWARPDEDTYIGFKVFKTMDYDDFIKSYAQDVALNPNSKYVLHLRMATAGAVDLDNCHPFVLKDSIVAHNGVLGLVDETNSGLSDTAIFVNEISEMSMKDIKKEAKALGSWAGHYNKFIVLGKDNSHVIINESQGTWYDGSWYSSIYYCR